MESGTWREGERSTKSSVSEMLILESLQDPTGLDVFGYKHIHILEGLDVFGQHQRRSGETEEMWYVSAKYSIL